eukprot:CAMPEP_0197463112 /NCGR_PEP_ID=MMETSP1175-20131217/60957_1 /TAXON_ID=1003142 /ORGANISM="Triceratium dubium, Strain CCMP147" /LENGTH=151 /DNA_ID=CAMNT_0042998791 /DNA_START=331 /DNA_END=784 /DNA_ORIENTATION=+
MALMNDRPVLPSTSQGEATAYGPSRRRLELGRERLRKSSSKKSKWSKMSKQGKKESQSKKSKGKSRGRSRSRSRSRSSSDNSPKPDPASDFDSLHDLAKNAVRKNRIKKCVLWDFPAMVCHDLDGHVLEWYSYLYDFGGGLPDTGSVVRFC